MYRLAYNIAKRAFGSSSIGLEILRMRMAVDIESRIKALLAHIYITLPQGVDVCTAYVALDRGRVKLEQV